MAGPNEPIQPVRPNAVSTPGELAGPGSAEWNRERGLIDPPSRAAAEAVFPATPATSTRIQPSQGEPGALEVQDGFRKRDETCERVGTALTLIGAHDLTETQPGAQLPQVQGLRTRGEGRSRGAEALIDRDQQLRALKDRQTLTAARGQMLRAARASGRSRENHWPQWMRDQGLHFQRAVWSSPEDEKAGERTARSSRDAGPDRAETPAQGASGLRVSDEPARAVEPRAGEATTELKGRDQAPESATTMKGAEEMTAEELERPVPSPGPGTAGTPAGSLDGTRPADRTGRAVPKRFARAKGSREMAQASEPPVLLSDNAPIAEESHKVVPAIDPLAAVCAEAPPPPGVSPGLAVGSEVGQPQLDSEREHGRPVLPRKRRRRRQRNGGGHPPEGQEEGDPEREPTAEEGENVEPSSH